MQGIRYIVNSGTQFHTRVGGDEDDGLNDDKDNVAIMVIQIFHHISLWATEKEVFGTNILS